MRRDQANVRTKLPDVRHMPSPRRSPANPRPLVAKPVGRRKLGPGTLACYGLILLAAALAILVIDAARLAHGVTHSARPAAVMLLDSAGNPITTLGDGWSRRLTLADVSPLLAAAVVATEDRRFFHHAGIDAVGIGRALVRNLMAGQVAQGGSTITQQLAKLAFLGPERSFLRKAREAALALWLEASLSKEEILAAYLDRVYLGGGVNGVRAAARRHFGIDARDLDLSQSALLAGMIRAPSRLDPGRNLEGARARAAIVLELMVEAGTIGRSEADAARAKPARVLPIRIDEPVLRSLAQRARRLWPGQALVVRTTLDIRLQQAARSVLMEALAKSTGRASAAALLAIDRQGQVAAASSVPGDLGGLDRILDVRRQPGAAFKPIVFAAAIEQGHAADERVATGPLTIGGWTPRNLTAPPADFISLTDALALSVNTSAVRLAMETGLDRVVQVARRLGIVSDLPAVPSLALGSSELTMPELASAYAALAGDGVAREPRWWTRASGENGQPLVTDRPPAVRAVEHTTARAMRAMLAEVMRRGTGKAAFIPGGFGKTGTSSGFRDAWFVGGDASGMIVVVWVGHDDHRPMNGETGGGLPARIFRSFMSKDG